MKSIVLKSGWSPWMILMVFLVIIATVLGALLYPKYDLRFIGFGCILLFDLYTFQGIRSWSLSFHWAVKALILIWFWLPIILLLFFIIGSSVWPLQSWPSLPRVYLSGSLVPLFISKILFLVFFYIHEIIVLPYNLWLKISGLRKKVKFSWFRSGKYLTTSLIISAIPMLLIFLGFRFWVYDFCIHRVEISDKKIPESFDGLKIVQLSDIHLGSWMSSQTLQRAFDKVNAERPDIIVFTGDLVNYVTGEAYPFRENMLSLTAPFGKYAILGNHDYGDYIHWKSQAEHDLNNLALEQFYHETGWQLLNNKHHNLINKTDTIVLAGVENWSQKKLWGQRGNLAKALAGSSNKSVKLLLSHDPTHWDGEVICNYPEILLTLSGHTHAMQIGFESEKFRWSPSSWIFSRWAGLYEHQTSVDDHQFLYVNRGLGHLGFPGRVGIRPEITVITLKKK